MKRSASGWSLRSLVLVKWSTMVSNFERIALDCKLSRLKSGTQTEFEDGFLRAELETRLLHIQPGELVLQGDISPPTKRVITYLLSQECGKVLLNFGKVRLTFENGLQKLVDGSRSRPTYGESSYTLSNGCDYCSKCFLQRRGSRNGLYPPQSKQKVRSGK